MKRIGFLGAYSIHNTGDLVLGYATRQAMRALLPDAEHVVFSPAFEESFWQHDFTRARGIDAEIRSIPPDDSTAWAKGLDAVVIGGGGIVGVAPAFRPFLLGEPRHWPDTVPAAWNGVGSQNTPWSVRGLEPQYALVKRCCEKLSYVSVRNKTTARFVHECGYEGALHVVPDPSLLLTLPEDDAVDRFLDEAGVDTSKFIIGVSVGAAVRDSRATPFYKDLFGSLVALTADKRMNFEIVLFPFGMMYGDDRFQEIAAAAMPVAKVVRSAMTPLECWRLVGRCDLHIATRYHAMLAAFAQDVPFLVIDEYFSDSTASSKIREFVADEELEAFYLCPFVSARPSMKLKNVLTLIDEEAVSFTARLEGARDRLREHHAALARALQLT